MMIVYHPSRNLSSIFDHITCSMRVIYATEFAQMIFSNLVTSSASLPNSTLPASIFLPLSALSTANVKHL